MIINNSKIIPVILCGGSGTRLWPLSRAGFPKQFLPLSGDGSSESLFQQAVLRINSIGTDNLIVGDTLVATNEDHRFLVLDQLRIFEKINANLLLEPVSRNTAPALTLAAMCAVQYSDHEDPILVISPADQVIQNSNQFVKALQDCIKTIEREPFSIAIMGVTPTAPEVGYGYIQSAMEKDRNNASIVQCFIEKPDVKTAKEFLTCGGYFWNSGLFVLRASTWLAAIKQFRGDIFDATKNAWNLKVEDSSEGTIFFRPDKELFASIPSESIDHAVIENCSSKNEEIKFSIKMVELDAGWSDLGAWDAVWQMGNQDENGNVIRGDTLIVNSNNSLVHASSRLVGLVGVENLIIVETSDAVLVADRRNSQDVKNIVIQLEQHRREEKNIHRKVMRPWGWYDNLDEGERFKVKRIQVKPGASLSLQMHHFRAEHWIVVKGVAEITNGEQVITLVENQSTYIPKGQTHRLSNPGKILLEIIEVQSGSYLGEDDIVRFEDVYGRN